jgi:DNA topoisomerase-1
MAQQWILRKGTKRSGFRYLTPQGKPASESAEQRIDALRIPPAWRDVHIAPSERAAVQAWGFDARGRKQYRYHSRAIEQGELRKYYRVRQMARDLPGLREALARDFAGEPLSRTRVVAGVVRLIAEGFFRVGNERYAKENRTFGLTTLHKSHVNFVGECVIFRYVGKKSITQRQIVCDPELVAFVREMSETPGRRLFRFRTGREWCDLSARDVNDYLHTVLNVPYTAKDFRTWGGTLRVATVLADLGAAESEREASRSVVMAVRMVAAELGNTPTICRKSYVHPMVIARYLDEGTTIEAFTPHRPRASRRTASHAHRPEERALIAFLDRFFPERRRKQRDPGDEEAAVDAAKRRATRKRAKAARRVA